MHCHASATRRVVCRCALVMTVTIATSIPLAPARAQSGAPPATGGAAAAAQAGAAGAPAARRVEGVAAVGFSTFIDEDFIEHVTVGGAARLPLSDHWSIEPRFIYMYGGAVDQDYYLLASLIYDLRTRGSVTPYWTVGGGVAWYDDGRIDYVSHYWHASGGFGIRLRLRERWSLVSEARLGLEPIFQVTAGLGYSF